MQDTIIKGSGNSRSIRFPPNAIAIWPSWEAFLADAISAAGAPCDLGPLNAAGVQQMGTKLTKANLLTDAVEKAIWGNAANRTPNQALQQLRALITTAQSTANDRAKIVYGTYEGNGIPGKDITMSLTFPFQPKLVFIAPINNHYMEVIFPYGAKQSIVIGQTNSTYSIVLAWSGNKVSWTDNTGSSNPNWNLNTNGCTYAYIAIA